MSNTFTDAETDQIADAIASAALYFATEQRTGGLLDAALDNHEDNLRAALRLIESMDGKSPFRKQRLETEWTRGELRAPAGENGQHGGSL